MDTSLSFPGFYPLVSVGVLAVLISPLAFSAGVTRHIRRPQLALHKESGANGWWAGGKAKHTMYIFLAGYLPMRQMRGW